MTQKRPPPPGFWTEKSPVILGLSMLVTKLPGTTVLISKWKKQWKISPTIYVYASWLSPDKNEVHVVDQ